MTETPPEAPEIVETTADLPSLDDLREWVKVRAEHLPDEDLAAMFTSSVAIIDETCRRVPRDEAGNPLTTGWPAPLVQAVKRRVQREIATRNLPLGVLDNSGEYGPARIPNYDVMIEELEGRFRRVVFG